MNADVSRATLMNAFKINDKDVQESWNAWHWGMPKDSIPSVSPAYTKGWTDALASIKAFNESQEIPEIKEPEVGPERETLQRDGKHPAPCAKYCESNAYEIEIRGLKRELALMRGKLIENDCFVPVGWALATLRATKEMKAAALTAQIHPVDSSPIPNLTLPQLDAIYCSMILKSPKPK